MHAFGGMYLDLDVSCYKSSEPFLQGHDLVFQSEKNEEDVSNAVVASITGHPFWNAVVRKMIVVSGPYACGKAPQLSLKMAAWFAKILGFMHDMGLPCASARACITGTSES